jgi:hypothetical protein
MQPPANPFSTRYTQPGRLGFLFRDDEDDSLDQVLGRFCASGLRGEIIGPHGTGKTTLLSHLLAALTQRGFDVAAFMLHDGQRRLPSGWTEAAAPASLVAVDGYEQLSHWSRWRLKRFCRRRDLGLVITAHAPMGLPALYRTGASLQIARRIVLQLLPVTVPPPSDDELSHLFDVFHGNVREMLFALYDCYERRG